MKLLNVGCGPVENGKTPGLEVVNVDSRAHPGATLENMEKLTYEDNSFDLVVCINALDHTQDAWTAVTEMIRVCKPKGWVYIDCALIQHTTSGKNHFWDALEDGRFEGATSMFQLKNLGFEVELIDNGMERRYNHMIARLQK